MRQTNSNGVEEKYSPTYRNQLLTIGDLEDFRDKLFAEIRDLLKEPLGQPRKQWLRSVEVRKLLGVSLGTLQNLRLNGTLPYTKIGGIVFYKYDHIIAVLENGKK